MKANVRMKGQGKAVRLTRHFLSRVSQRFGIILNQADVIEIIRRIQNKETEYVGCNSNTKTHHKITYKDKEMIVVYDKERELLVTALMVSQADWDNWIDDCLARK